MSDDEKVEIARLAERHAALAERVAKLEGNQRWVVLALMGAVLKAVLDGLKVLQ